MPSPYKFLNGSSLQVNGTAILASDVSRITVEELPREKWHATSFSAYGSLLLIIMAFLSILFLIMLVFTSAVMAVISVLIIGVLSVGGIFSSNHAPLVPTARIDIILKNGEKHVVGDYPRSRADKIQGELEEFLEKSAKG